VILALDSEVLVHWVMAGAPHHAPVRSLLAGEVREADGQLGLTPQVLVATYDRVTDSRCFEHPMPAAAAATLVRKLWDGREVARLLPGVATLHRALELVQTQGLARDRLPDAFLAATLEGAGVRALATLRPRDFASFAFLKLVVPS